MDDRTSEQRAADQGLHDAVERAVRAYSVLPASSVVTNWMVIGTGLGSDDQGDIHANFAVLPDGGRGLSHTTLLGMLYAARLRAEAEFLEPDDVD